MAHQGAASAKVLRPDSLPRPVGGGLLGKEMCKPGRPERTSSPDAPSPASHLLVAWGEGSPLHQTWIISCQHFQI